jgi:hypothetical protein
MQCAMDWIRTMVESLNVEGEDGKLCARRQMGRQSQLATTFPTLHTHATLGKASCAVLGVFTPRVAYTINDRGGQAHLSDGVGQPIGNPRK